MVMVEPSFREVRDYFFTCMVEGYAGGKEAKPIAGLPGWKGYVFAHEHLRLIDMYIVNKQTGDSAGVTTIWKYDQPVFHMTYGGRYEKSVTPLLKQALLSGYKGRHVDYFFRGPSLLQMDRGGPTYYNEIGKDNQGLTHFWGRECIKGPDHKELGYHTYEGWTWM